MNALLWYVAGLVVSFAIAWVAALLQLSGYAPVGIVSLGVGLALGAALHVLAATLRVAGHRRHVVGTVVLALVTVLAQHAWLYGDFRRQWHEARARSPEVALFRPESPWSPREYFSHEVSPQRVVLWCVDAALIVTAAVGAIAMLERKRP
ncbi:MAG: hypothetical protein WD738_21145 [Pirellulales bacterium]